VKKVLNFPIGERWLAISVLAAIGGGALCLSRDVIPGIGFHLLCLAHKSQKNVDLESANPSRSGSRHATGSSTLVETTWRALRMDDSIALAKIRVGSGDLDCLP